MMRWFREHAPIRRKLAIAFSLQTILVAAAGAAGLLAARGLLSFPAAAGTAAGVLAIGAAIGLAMRRAIAEPYVATVIRMEALAAGDLDQPIHFTGHRDCVGRMTRAMHAFRAEAIARQNAESRAAESERATIGAREEREAAAARQAAEQAQAMRSVGGELERLAAGDLTARLGEDVGLEYETLRRNFNTAVERLRGSLEAVATNISGIHGGTNEIARATEDLSRRTEQQAASLEQTAAAMDEITATVRKTADGAEHARDVVGRAKQDAERSGVVVRDAVAAMGGIERSSRQIGQIIGVIDEIAFQTNLLALNAGVEAARAGEAGRGFAVVASEVRALAQRSADAAREIKGLVSTSGKQVEDGVKLVDQAGVALERIVAQVAEINGAVTEIAASAQEQATGLAEVNTAVNQMDQVTQQNAAMVEET
ncbi:MAG: methyl-accepting chemotaxis protein, partial [Gluconacetobacter diazotrophicus]|nr:methyl-accepting chemotaxis protein [Gluconacetobacter diazotrophicus]